MNNLALSAALATAPSSAFVELRERPRFWFPLLLVVFTTVALNYWYFSVVDIEWLKATFLSADPGLQKMTEEQRAVAMSMYSRNVMLYGSMVSIFIVLPAVLLLQALYLLVVGKVTRLSPGFKHWFALSCWTSLPVLLSTVVAAILLLLADNAQVAPGVVAPLSLNELVLHVPEGSPGHTLFQSLNIPALLCWALMIIGFRTWSQRSWGFSAVVVLLPWVVIYGVWAFFIFR